jgi:hypothetical protein
MMRMPGMGIGYFVVMAVFLRVLIVSLVVVIVVLVLGFVECACGKRRSPIAIVHLPRAAVAHCAECLFLLVLQAEACAGTTAIALLALQEFVFLLGLQVIDLAIQGVLHLFARTTQPWRWACCKRCERQEGTDRDPTRGPVLTHIKCLLDTNIFHTGSGIDGDVVL